MALRELKELSSRYIENEELRKLVESILDNPVLSFTNTAPLIKIEDSPAAPRKHHFFTGGLLIHTYSVARIAMAITDIFESIYGIKANRDVVLATAMLHDIFKYYQYTVDDVNGGYRARDDWYLGHDYAVIAELVKRGAPDHLIRSISEVHGQVPFTTIEGIIVHLADSIDARFGEILQNMLLNKIKEFEKDCAIYKTLDHLIKIHGLRQVITITQSNLSEFKRQIAEECIEES